LEEKRFQDHCVGRILRCHIPGTADLGLAFPVYRDIANAHGPAS
jgi:hypothetical protein